MEGNDLRLVLNNKRRQTARDSPSLPPPSQLPSLSQHVETAPPSSTVASEAETDYQSPPPTLPLPSPFASDTDTDDQSASPSPTGSETQFQFSPASPPLLLTTDREERSPSTLYVHHAVCGRRSLHTRPSRKPGTIHKPEGHFGDGTTCV